MSDVVYINGSLAPVKFNTLVAVTDGEQARGLMWMKWPPPVMCFPYRKIAIRKFWMKNTISPLDILFCCGNSIVGIGRGEPLSTAPIGPDEPSDLVIELPAGSVNEHRISVGDTVRLAFSPETLARQIVTG